MSGLGGVISGDDGPFGPGTDLVLSLTAVLVLMVFAMSFDLSDLQAETDRDRQARAEVERERDELLAERDELVFERDRLAEALEDSLRREQERGLDLEEVRKAQLDLVRAIARRFDTQLRRLSANSYGLYLEGSAEPDLTIENEATLQRIRFGSNVLFDFDQYKLKPQGQVVLDRFAEVLRSRLGSVSEIQLQGHADMQQTTRFESNLVLASWRAMEVFDFLSHRGIDPTRHLMSATSFGEYVPVSRRQHGEYGPERLVAANDTPSERSLNRRIEVILVYRLAAP